MTSAEESKLKRIRYYDSGKCINGCGQPLDLDCGLCRTCAYNRAANKRKWYAKNKLSPTPNNQPK